MKISNNEHRNISSSTDFLLLLLYTEMVPAGAGCFAPSVTSSTVLRQTERWTCSQP